MDRDDEHYMRDVLALGDRHRLVAAVAIFSHSGIKLVNAGTPVNSAFYERLVQHKLLPPLDQSLTVENCVNSAQLRECAERMLSASSPFARMTRLVNADVLLNAFAQIELPSPLAFKLTVAREQRPSVFDHSVEVALVAVYVQAMEGHLGRDLTTAATAGLLHDIGILHIPSACLQPGKRLSPTDRRYLYSHPITAQLIVSAYAGIDPIVGSAIKEHHERMDGSGYPRGLTADRISVLGKVLMLADAGAALLKSKEGQQGAIALRLLRRKFCPELLAHLMQLFARVDDGSDRTSTVDPDVAYRQLNALTGLLLAWRDAYVQGQDEWSDRAAERLLSLVDQRVSDLERSLLEAGLAAEDLEAYVAIASQDPAGTSEMRELAREGMWQMRDIAFEARRRWAESQAAETDLPVLARWLTMVDTYLAVF